MDWKSRHIIYKSTEMLKKRIDLKMLRPLIEKLQIFTKAMLDDIYDPSNDDLFYDLLCTRGPSAFSKFIDILRQSPYKNLSRILRVTSNRNEDYTPISYKMTSNPIGYCLIIINEKFDELPTLLGIQIDAPALESLFESLGYIVRVAWNLKKEEMINYFVELSHIPYLSQVDSIVIFIVTHGNQINDFEVLWGTDLQPVFLADIYSRFDNNNCPRLRGKPKLFFFQSCRGSEESLHNYVCKNLSSDEVEHNTTGVEKETIVRDPALTDMIVVHSTLPYHMSLLDHEEGSWLCQDIVNVFSINFLRDDLETMLKSVCKRMEKRSSDDTTKQTIHVELFGVLGTIKFGHNV